MLSERLGREGWLRIEVELESSGWLQLVLDFEAKAELSRPSCEGLFLHPFTLTLACNGCVVNEWSDALSHHWTRLPHKIFPGAGGAEQLAVAGSIPLLDISAPARSTLEIHLKLPWKDVDKAEGFEASSRLQGADIRLLTLGRWARLVGAPGLERVIVGAG